MATSKPSPARASAMPLPRPRLAPVTSAAGGGCDSGPNGAGRSVAAVVALGVVALAHELEHAAPVRGSDDLPRRRVTLEAEHGHERQSLRQQLPVLPAVAAAEHADVGRD